MKTWLSAILVLILTQAACNSPLAETAVRPAVTEVSTLLTPSTTSISVSPTPLVSDQSTPVANLEPSPVVIETLAPTPTFDSGLESPTPTAAQDVFFSDVSLSVQVISPNCGPKVVHFEATPAQALYGAVLFYRLRYKISGDRTDWNNGVPMHSSEGKFIYDLSAASLTDFNSFKEPVAWVQYQLVAIGPGGYVIGRSIVFADKLTISTICP
jgi:hypothetical protein